MRKFKHAKLALAHEDFSHLGLLHSAAALPCKEKIILKQHPLAAFIQTSFEEQPIFHLRKKPVP